MQMLVREDAHFSTRPMIPIRTPARSNTQNSFRCSGVRNVSVSTMLLSIQGFGRVSNLTRNHTTESWRMH